MKRLRIRKNLVILLGLILPISFYTGSHLLARSGQDLISINAPANLLSDPITFITTATTVIRVVFSII